MPTLNGKFEEAASKALVLEEPVLYSETEDVDDMYLVDCVNSMPEGIFLEADQADPDPAAEPETPEPGIIDQVSDILGAITFKDIRQHKKIVNSVKTVSLMFTRTTRKEESRRGPTPPINMNMNVAESPFITQTNKYGYIRVTLEFDLRKLNDSISKAMTRKKREIPGDLLSRRPTRVYELYIPAAKIMMLDKALFQQAKADVAKDAEAAGVPSEDMDKFLEAGLVIYPGPNQQFYSHLYAAYLSLFLKKRGKLLRDQINMAIKEKIASEQKRVQDAIMAAEEEGLIDSGQAATARIRLPFRAGDFGKMVYSYYLTYFNFNYFFDQVKMVPGAYTVRAGMFIPVTERNSFNYVWKEKGIFGKVAAALGAKLTGRGGTEAPKPVDL